MDLLKYINGVLFIDDKKEDVTKLYSYFEKYNIPCMYINPNEYDGEISDTIGFARFVFLDIEFMSGTPNLIDVVSLLRDLAEKGMKNVVVIMWTLHDDLIEELKKMIDEKMEKDKPVLIVNAVKSEFMDLDEEQYCSKLEALFSKSISESPFIFKLLEWEKSSNIATYKTFNDIMELSFNDDNGSFELSKALANMASQNIPSNAISSAFDTANDMLVDKIKLEVDKIEEIELKSEADEKFLKKMNYYMMFTKTGLKKEKPGNIYINDSISNNFKEKMVEKNIEEDNITPILVDLTPGCTFAHSDNLILLDGVIFNNIDEQKRKKIKGCFGSEYYLKDLYIDDENKLNYIIMDCLNIISLKKEDMDKDKIMMCIKETYRVSLQQKFGHYLARIGDNIYHGKK